MKRIFIPFTLMAVCCFLFAVPNAGLAQPEPALASPGASGAGGAPPPREHIMAALRALESAREKLNHAATVYGGHRRSALKATDRAIYETHAALNFVATKRLGQIPPAPPVLGGQRRPARGYPSMHGAIHDLMTARSELQHGGPVYGGHREKAVRSVDQAIRECRAALSYVHSR
jgi:hypothetical protein